MDGYAGEDVFLYDPKKSERISFFHPGDQDDLLVAMMECIYWESVFWESNYEGYEVISPLSTPIPKTDIYRRSSRGFCDNRSDFVT
jgi:hypothetical protein